MNFFKFNLRFSAVIIAFAFAMVSCSDDDDNHAHPASTATITFASPAENSTLNGGDTLFVAGTITSQMQIHGYKIYVRNTTAGTDSLLVDDHAHATEVPFSGMWVSNVTAHSDMEAEVVVTLDHDGNTASKKVHFHAMP